ncbi:hypothetical protein M514_00205 [Trichuris suis]|uniref:Uncharacterized protein n=1 Tax=Trichuris suis TaxID=68888 RepID=A0A085NUD6_9BILA|nr:hypothetical protein M513_00205 [Trichuris suis]KFD73082.1 hypothetical protein M514_00205 [Trichuris suis]
MGARKHVIVELMVSWCRWTVCIGRKNEPKHYGIRLRSLRKSISCTTNSRLHRWREKISDNNNSNDNNNKSAHISSDHQEKIKGPFPNYLARFLRTRANDQCLPYLWHKEDEFLQRELHWRMARNRKAQSVPPTC